MSPENPKTDLPPQQDPQSSIEEISKKREGLLNILDEIEHGQQIGAYGHLLRIGLVKSAEKLFVLLKREFIDVALRAAEQMPINRFENDIEKTFDVVCNNPHLDSMLHKQTYLVARLLFGPASVYLSDVALVKTLKVYAIAAEVISGHSRINAEKIYEVLDDREGLARTAARNYVPLQGVWYKKELYDNYYEFRQRFVDAANKLREETREFVVDLDQIVLEVKQEIDNELKALEAK